LAKTAYLKLKTYANNSAKDQIDYSLYVTCTNTEIISNHMWSTEKKICKSNKTITLLCTHNQ